MKNKKLAVCVPYRNREKHLALFVPRITEYLANRGIDHKIFVCHQIDNKEFNRGKTKNIAFDVARKEGYDYFAFHDIDLIPENDTCDYSFPEKHPVHIATKLSSFNYNLPYPQYFGGIVIFSGEQFEKINGYNNDYWGWGAEDDDLFYRCNTMGYTNIEDIGQTFGEKYAAFFNRQGDHIQIDSSPSLASLTNNSYTFSLMVKTDHRSDIPLYNFGDKTSTFIHMPIISRDGFSFFTYTNTYAYNSIVIDDQKNMTDLWIKRYMNQWTHIMISVDTKKRTMRLYVNGREANHIDGEGEKSPVGFSHPLYDFTHKPYIIGSKKFDSFRINAFFDKLVKSSTTSRWFKGQIANMRFWNKAFTPQQAAAYFAAPDNNTFNDTMVLHYDFETVDNKRVIDKSGNNNHGKISGCKIEKTHIGHMQSIALPYRRECKFRALFHQTEAPDYEQDIKKNTFSQSEKDFALKLQYDDLGMDKHGLTDLDYELVRKEVIFDNHMMLHVKC